MIPLVYRRRERVRLVRVRDSWRVVCDLPLSVLAVNDAAARLLQRTCAAASVAALAVDLGLDEERVLRSCEQFRRLGLLDVAVDPSEEATPSVSVIVPAKDRAAELVACLTAIFAQDYPHEALEVLVVDDGSRDETAEVARRFPCRVLVDPVPRGQSFARNRAAAVARGEVLAFIDSDCVADRRWLRELVPFFAWDRLVAVGGSVAGFASASSLDRYEAVSSSLNMGGRLIVSLDTSDSFYVPSCNLLVRRSSYAAVGGMRVDMSVGEDVDLCWRLRAQGGVVAYAPVGSVSHRHRGSVGAMMRRRMQYGTSEALLQTLHGDKPATLPLTPLPLLTALTLLSAVAAREPRLAPLALVPLAWDAGRRSRHLRREGVTLPAARVAFATVRGHLSYLYFILFRLVRYHLLVLIAAGLAVRAAWLLAAVAVLYTSAVDHTTRRPRLDFPRFLVYSVLEHSAYQVGVGLGCLRQGTLRPYKVVLRGA
jgi:mycofactocin system glycosyltransferase